MIGHRCKQHVRHDTRSTRRPLLRLDRVGRISPNPRSRSIPDTQSTGTTCFLHQTLSKSQASLDRRYFQGPSLSPIDAPGGSRLIHPARPVREWAAGRKRAEQHEGESCLADITSRRFKAVYLLVSLTAPSLSCQRRTSRPAHSPPLLPRREIPFPGFSFLAPALASTPPTCA